MDFMQDCASRIRNRVHVTTEAHKAYLEAVEGAFGYGRELRDATKSLRRTIR